MKGRVTLVLACALTACGSLFSPLPNEVVLASAEPIFNVGHPRATYGRAEVVGSANGSLFGGGGTHDTYVDMDVHYTKGSTPHVMKMRFYVHSMDPCHITTDVLQDTGPPPILLDNGIASEEIGREMCARITEARAPAP